MTDPGMCKCGHPPFKHEGLGCMVEVPTTHTRYCPCPLSQEQVNSQVALRWALVKPRFLSCKKCGHDWEKHNPPNAAIDDTSCQRCPCVKYSPRGLKPPTQFPPAG